MLPVGRKLMPLSTSRMMMEMCDIDAAASIFASLGLGLEDSDVRILAQDFTADEDRGFLRGITVSRNAHSISHLMFADDGILFCSADQASYHALQQVLSLYSKASGQTDICVQERDEQVYTLLVGSWRINIDAAINSIEKKLGVVVRDDCDNVKAGMVVLIVGLVPPEVAEAKVILAAIYWLQATKFPVTVIQPNF
uniref:Uncharacterized protein n=1 Tax=Cannabis sativa TaxID=3483 RepID=A0A803NHN5_CANSA